MARDFLKNHYPRISKLKKKKKTRGLYVSDRHSPVLYQITQKERVSFVSSVVQHSNDALFSIFLNQVDLKTSVLEWNFLVWLYSYNTNFIFKYYESSAFSTKWVSFCASVLSYLFPWKSCMTSLFFFKKDRLSRCKLFPLKAFELH